ncbi:hypothetical protein DFH09DRAFT_1148777 [Mycena vulgaris]|nr:hypothetical protein DFH09DRAFT_1148777 [Mycena vulgaris]
MAVACVRRTNFPLLCFVSWALSPPTSSGEARLSFVAFGKPSPLVIMNYSRRTRPRHPLRLLLPSLPTAVEGGGGLQLSWTQHPKYPSKSPMILSCNTGQRRRQDSRVWQNWR